MPRTMSVSYPNPRAMQSQNQAMDWLQTEYQTAMDKANAANNNRFRHMLKLTNQQTNQGANDIRSSYTGQMAAANQNFAQQGLAGTTVPAAIMAGYQREQAGALNRNADGALQTKLGIIERREDIAPDMQMLAMLAQRYGASGAGGGGSSYTLRLPGMRA